MREWTHLGENVLLVDTEGQQWSGVLESCTMACDSDSGENEYVLRTEIGPVFFLQSEIRGLLQ